MLVEECIKFYDKNRFNLRFFQDCEEYKEIINLTKFLDKDAAFQQRMWHIKNNVYFIPKCKICGKPVKFSLSKGYGNYCSNQCIGKDKDNTTKKFKKTCLEKYGVEHYSQTKNWKDKKRQTSLEKYGVDDFSKTEEFKEKVKEVNLNRYGVENYSQTKEFFEKYRINLIKYHRNLIKNEHSDLIYIDSLSNHESKYKCKICGNEFSMKSNVFNNRKRYNQTICPICNPLQKQYSCEEKQVLNYIKSIYSGEIIENTRKIIYPYELDIYLPEINLAFEFNGDFWHANPNLYEYNSIIINKQAWEIWEKDRKKSDMCNKKQIKLITIWENDWNYKNNICRRYINIIISKCQKLLI